VVSRLIGAGHQAFLVGGAVRDLLLGQQPGDFDIATDASPQQIVELFLHTQPVGEAFGVVLVIQDGVAVETATFRTEGSYLDRRHPARVALTGDLVTDAQRRDFTVNALYLDPAQGRILDPVGGIADCRRRLLRTVGDATDRLREDALRLLRAPRLAAQCRLTVDPATKAAMATQKEGLRQVAAERIGQELGRLLTGPDPVLGLEMMAETGVLQIPLPEVMAMRGVPQPPQYHPEGDVWTHTMLMFRNSPSRSLPLGLAILLHDVGKPPTITHADRIRFNGHAKLGAVMTGDICRRLRFPRTVSDRAVDLVAQHLRFLDVQHMRPATLKRFLRQEQFAEHLELHRLDCLSSHRQLDNYDFCQLMLQQLATADLRPPPLLRGADLLALGFKEGPQIGRILRELETAQLEGKVGSREEALAWLREHHPHQ
jgi:poly(A) polymerase